MSLPNAEVSSPPSARAASTVSTIGASTPLDRRERLAASVLEPPELTLPTSWPTVQQALSEICHCLTEALPMAESAGVVVLPADGASARRRRTLDGAAVISNAPAGEALIQVERQVDEGPVLTACRSQSVVTSGDLAADARWRRFGEAVVELHMLSALSVPLPDRSGDTAGVLSLYSQSRNAFDARAHDVTAAIGHVITNALFVAEMVQRTRQEFDRIQAAWERSAIINQAVGVLIRANCTEEQARSRLTRMAKRNEQDVAAAARIIVDEARTEAHLEFIVARKHS